MSNILAVYGSAYGQTFKIIQRIAGRLSAAGHQVTIWKGDLIPDEVRADQFDGFLVGASVLRGRHQQYVEEFVRTNVTALNSSPSAFISVCGAAAPGYAEGPALALNYVAQFLGRTGWHPSMARPFAGALAYTRYGWLTRWLMKMISKHTGRPTDTSRDYEFTDWAEVDSLASELAARFGAVPAAAAAKT